jgi:N-methylhydantoinase B/oxoprolinase/acetone carboxylase alpha subunit
VSREQAAVRRAALRQCHDLTAQIAALRKGAAKETQLARQVDLNMTLLRLISDLTIAKQRL